MTSFGSYLSAPWQARTWRQIAYHVVSLPVAITLFVYAVTMYALGVGLAVLWVGLFILIGVQVSLRPLGAFERGLANGFMGTGIRAPMPMRRSQEAHRGGTRLLRWMHDLVHDGHSWRVLLWILGRIVLAPVGFALAVVAAVVPISLVAAVVLAVAHALGLPWPSVSTDDAVAADVVDTVQFWVLVGSPLVLLLAPMFAWLMRGYTALTDILARWGLGPCGFEEVEVATARAQLAEEQVRIDQELHDSIGHMITMNIVQAGAGAHVFDSDPEFARQALRNIEERGRAAMGELDRIIAAIRGDKPGERAPLPGLADLDALVQTARGAGMNVESFLEPPAAPPAVGRAVFGIVREGLTNVAKHAPGAGVRVTVCADGDAVAVEVVNGPGTGDATVEPLAPGARARHGLAGIRDRVGLLGGRSSAGPEAGGFAVRALVPLEAQLAPAGPAGSPWCDLREKVTA